MQIEKLIEKGESWRATTDQLNEAIPYFPPWYHEEDFNPIEDMSQQAILIDCCYVCAPMIWIKGKEAQEPGYVCDNCGSDVSYVLERKKIERWW